MSAPRANSPTSPATRDRIAVDTVSTDAIDRIHAEADRTGRTVAAIAADWLDTYHPPTRRVVLTVSSETDMSPDWSWVMPDGTEAHYSGPMEALVDAQACHPRARIEDAGPGRYELVEDA